MSDATKGVLALLLACTVWGLSPIYYAQLGDVPPFEVLCYRALWSLVFFVIILLAQRRLHLVWQALRSRRNFWVILLAALMISANWFGFIYAISAGRAVESSLGYYIFPLVAVFVGWAAFKERLLRTQWLAIGFAALAVGTLTVGLGVWPYIALGLSLTFVTYGIIKRQLSLGPVVSVTAEVLVLAPVAAVFLLLSGTQSGASLSTHLLLGLAGPLTATPLILFSFAARRLRLSTIGVIQYVNPTLQFACAVLYLGEPFTPWHGIAFPLIWLALAIYTVAQFRQDRASRKATSSAATVSTRPM